MSEARFNPLDIPNIASSLVLELIESDLRLLPPIERPSGAGIYAIYYDGSFDAYSPVRLRHQDSGIQMPLYVGKAVRTGTRKGIDFSPTNQKAIYKRLKIHHDSIESAENLSAEDFRCRYLIVEDSFIGLAESVLISIFRPVWNQVVDGFGNNPTGGPRRNQARSDWDVLHPGRTRGQGEAKHTESDLLEKIKKHFMEQETPKDTHLAKIARRITHYSQK